MNRRNNNERGTILLVFVITLPFLILIAIYYTQTSLVSFRIARQDQLRTAAQLSADAGADLGVLRTSQDNAWAGTTGEVELSNDTRTKTTYEISVAGNVGNTKTMTVIGRSYSPVSSATPAKKVKIFVDMRPISGGDFGIISGQGGLIMVNNSKVVGGDVFINGEVKLSNSAQIGLSTKPVDVKVAHQICPVPADATFPRICNNGEFGEPIMISGLAKIYGKVTANNQSNGAGMSLPGLTAGTVTTQALPTYNRAAQKAAVATNMTGAAASCNGSQNINWPANLKITGDVAITGQCNVTVSGNVWITGNLTMGNTSIMKVSDTLGTTAPNIMIDGSTGATFSQSAKLASNASVTGFKIYTFWSNGTCSPDCTNLTGPDLASSRTVTTINLQNSASGPNTVFYAYWSQVSVGNSGAIGAIIGQTIYINNSGTLTFGASVQVGGPTVYVVNGYRRS
jgi:hypothetical protein